MLLTERPLRYGFINMDALGVQTSIEMAKPTIRRPTASCRINSWREKFELRMCEVYVSWMPGKMKENTRLDRREEQRGKAIIRKGE